jgi:hypothetical protein
MIASVVRPQTISAAQKPQRETCFADCWSLICGHTVASSKNQATISTPFARFRTRFLLCLTSGGVIPIQRIIGQHASFTGKGHSIAPNYSGKKSGFRMNSENFSGVIGVAVG